MNYTVYDSSVSSYYSNFIWTSKDWVAFDISDTQTIVLIGSYECNNNSISGTTQQVVTISTSNNYNSVPDISVVDVDDREDIVNFSSSLSYRMYSNIDNAPTQRNVNYETSYNNYFVTYTLLVVVIVGFLFTWIKGVLPWNKTNS